MSLRKNVLPCTLISADTSLPSPCLLEGMQPVQGTPEMSVVTVSEGSTSRRPSTGQLPPTIPKKERLTGGAEVNGTPSRMGLPPPPAMQTRSRDNSENSSQCIFPELLDSTESIPSLYRHFSLAFRPFFSLYKIKTIRDLSAMAIDKVKQFGLKDPVLTVTNALEEYSGRRTRLKNTASRSVCSRQ